MGRRASVLVVVLVLVGAPLGVFLGARVDGSTSQAERQHFFQVGERECTQALKAFSAGSGVQAQFAFKLPAGYPARDLRYEEAGCREAVRRWPVIGYGSPPPG